MQCCSAQTFRLRSSVRNKNGSTTPTSIKRKPRETRANWKIFFARRSWTDSGFWSAPTFDDILDFSSPYHLFPARDYVLLHVARHYCVVGEFEVRDAAAFGRTSELGREAEHFRERYFCGDDAGYPALAHRLDGAALRIDHARYVADLTMLLLLPDFGNQRREQFLHAILRPQLAVALDERVPLGEYFRILQIAHGIFKREARIKVYRRIRPQYLVDEKCGEIEDPFIDLRLLCLRLQAAGFSRDEIILKAEKDVADQERSEYDEQDHAPIHTVRLL